ncbi:exocyst complex component Sec5-domain-containing protein [Microdochium trichocladiopsis]|uniref:Exocyst complex component SEC5 n=1 Tax=Microdochium trichocladiopsis TaxID=1682393 RepID=A0A9P8Y979_9PEZI|nr:exocyst complex component Sec5-domain-containing protein [Microdochium trichocladiopsis]KAH7031109.1 exocyst complex component Sec5-domain-containing protein [Microdochium trichocladiopsis]
MADFDRNVLEFYGLTNPYPTQWPADKDNNTDDEDSEQEQPKAKLNRRKSRYQALERAVSTRASIMSGSEKSASGVSNLVQKDEPDPLGSTDSVVRTLRKLGVPVQDDVRLRNRFLLSSTSFTPALFLSQMHANADTEALLNGLDVLSRSIDQKSASLKVLVESNFERFVRAKATIDNVYKEMKYRGAEPPPSPRQQRGHSHHASRNSFRSSSGGAAMMQPPVTPTTTDGRKKNALVKESDYGVMGIKAPLLDVSAKAEDVWGPALGGREKEENLKTVMTSMERYREYVETSSAIADSIKRKDYEALVEEYNRARKFAEDARKLVKDLGSTPPSETQTYQILLSARMWYDVEEQIQLFKRDIWRRLTSSHNFTKTDTLSGQSQDQHMEFISILLELGVEDNPIWVWLLSRYDHLKGKINVLAERAKVEIEVLRRRLAHGEKPSRQTIAANLRILGRQSIESNPAGLDSPDVIELWEKMQGFLNGLLSMQGVLGEVVDFWQIVDGFIEGRTQKSLPRGYNGESEVHHTLSEQGRVDLCKGAVELVDMIRTHVFEFFAGPPPEDISLLFSPLPPSPGTPRGGMTPSMRDPRFNFDDNNLPPPSPKRGESWEKFAFWPPNSNSLSGVHYLSKMLVLVGSGASEMASMAPVARDDGKQLELLRNMVGAARERCVTALCGAWNADAQNIKLVEDWRRSKEMGDVTRMPASFSAFEGALLAGMQKILYISEAQSKPGARDIVLPPPTKLLQMVRSQYVTTLYKALSGMVENAERAVKKTDDEWAKDLETQDASGTEASILVGAEAVDAGDRNVRMLLTLSNLQALRSQVVPNLNGQFENAFSVKLTDESKTIRDVLGQIDARLFQTYTRPSVESLRRIIRAGLADPSWSTPGRKPTEVKPYVYDALLTLVLVHTQVSTTAPTLTSQVLSYLLEQTSRELLDALKAQHSRFDLPALMQATLDVEFAAQTLSQYTTEKASTLQGEIYTMLDAKTDDQARASLQQELPGMREILKKLRDQSRGEFACFKRPRGTTSAGNGGSGSGGGGVGAGGARTNTPGPGPDPRASG